jgi:hypothetical protein
MAQMAAQIGNPPGDLRVGNYWMIRPFTIILGSASGGRANIDLLVRNSVAFIGAIEITVVGSWGGRNANGYVRRMYFININANSAAFSTDSVFSGPLESLGVTGSSISLGEPVANTEKRGITVKTTAPYYANNYALFARIWTNNNAGNDAVYWGNVYD